MSFRLVLAALACVLAAPWTQNEVNGRHAEFGRVEAQHLLNRAGFCATPEQISEVMTAGRERAVHDLVSSTALGAGTGLPPFFVETFNRPRDYQERDLSETQRRQLANEARRRDAEQLARFRDWWIDRMVRSPAVLEEKMTWFLSGLFTSSQREVNNGVFMIRQNQLLRQFALGNFRVLLHEIARDPAMLAYLNNRQNRKSHPNENFAREVMELFTLGVGNYSEEDIREAARAFTGWTFADGRFTLDTRQHDYGQKTLFGHTGPWNGDDVLDLLLARDAATSFLARRLLGFFATSDAPEEVITRYAELLRNHDWEIRPVLTALFTDPWFYSDAVVGARILGPIEYCVSISRKLPGGVRPPAGLIAAACESLGQTLFAPPNVKGWEGGEAWMSTSSLMTRGNIALGLVAGLDRSLLDTRLASGKIELKTAPRILARFASWKPAWDPAEFVRSHHATSPDDVVDVMCSQFLSVPVTPEARTTLVAFLTEDLTPGEQFHLDGPLANRKLKKLVHLILSLPEAQLA